MTLFKQISILVSLAFVLLFALISYDNLQQSSVFLRGQLSTTAQDTATVLGISISTTGSGNDAAALDTLFNAVFDSGYYSDIRLIATDGTVIHSKHRELGVENVPDWFISKIPLQSTTGRANVMLGWVPLGQVELTLHPGYAYASLYENLITTITWFFTTFALILSLLWYILHIVLKPLETIHEQVQAIDENRFIQQTSIPKTLELRRIVEVINRLVEKVHKVFQDQETTLSRYQALLYTDKLTGLGNRNHMLSKIEHAVAESTSFNGSMIIIKIQGLDYIKEHKGYADADAIVKKVSDLILNRDQIHPDDAHARISDNELSILLAHKLSVAEALVADLFERFKQTHDSPHEVSLIAGLVDIYSGRNSSEILADLDFALTQAMTSGPYTYSNAAPADLILPHGKMQWRSWFQQSLANDAFYLVSQNVCDKDNKVLHKEVFIRANDENAKSISAGVFMPMALALGFGRDIDLKVFQLLKDIADKHSDKSPLALNLSPSFFNHADAFMEFRKLLDHYKKHSATLCVEATHASFQNYPEMCTQVADTIRQAGQIVGIDQFDLNGSMQILQRIRPNYIKINAKVLDQIGADAVSAAYQALRTLTTTLDIHIIAVGVDDQELYERLLLLNIDAAQGNLLGQPREIQ